MVTEKLLEVVQEVKVIEDEAAHYHGLMHDCRDYLMSVSQHETTFENAIAGALEALGYGRNGLDTP